MQPLGYQWWGPGWTGTPRQDWYPARTLAITESTKECTRIGAGTNTGLMSARIPTVKRLSPIPMEAWAAAPPNIAAMARTKPTMPISLISDHMDHALPCCVAVLQTSLIRRATRRRTMLRTHLQWYEPGRAQTMDHHCASLCVMHRLFCGVTKFTDSLVQNGPTRSWEAIADAYWAPEKVNPRV
jgi:hypothetical protein